MSVQKTMARAEKKMFKKQNLTNGTRSQCKTVARMQKRIRLHQMTCKYVSQRKLPYIFFFFFFFFF